MRLHRPREANSNSTPYLRLYYSFKYHMYIADPIAMKETLTKASHGTLEYRYHTMVSISYTCTQHMVTVYV